MAAYGTKESMSCVEEPILICKETLISNEDNCSGMKVNDAADQPHGNGGRIKLMGTSIDNGNPNIKSVNSASVQGADDAATTTTPMSNKGGSKAVDSQRYKDVMDALLKPCSSYALLYEPHVVPSPKTPPKEEEKRKSTQISVHKSMTVKKIHTKKEPEFRSFPQNVKTLTATGMLDGVAVRYLSASREKELRGTIKGASYLCGCTSCNFSKEVTALEFESHADFKTSHPNNHIHLENGKSLHQVVQELKNTPPSMLCDAIETVIGAASLNREAFSSWKESYEAGSRKRQRLD